MKKRSALVSVLLLSAVFLFTACSDPDGMKMSGDQSVKSIPGTIATSIPLKWENGTYGGVWRDTYTEDPKSYNSFFKS